MTLLHFGDPCVHCEIPHDDVAPGPCLGDPEKAVPVSWRFIGARWDGVDQYLIRMSDGQLVDRWEHYSMSLPYTYLRNARCDFNLKRPQS